jgi:hypothetical protein
MEYDNNHFIIASRAYSLQPGLKVDAHFSSHAYPPHVEKMSKKINKNDKNFKFQKSFDMHVPHAINF